MIDPDAKLVEALDHAQEYLELRIAASASPMNVSWSCIFGSPENLRRCSTNNSAARLWRPRKKKRPQRWGCEAPRPSKFKCREMTNRHVDQIAKAAIVPGVRSGHIAAAQSGAIIRARRSRGALEYSNLMTSPVPEITVRGGYFRVTGSSHLRDTNPVLGRSGALACWTRDNAPAKLAGTTRPRCSAFDGSIA
jgi:hypothetical protein